MMRAVVLVLVAGLVCGCTPRKTNEEFLASRIITDPETGCEYFLDYKAGFTARLDKNGFPICGDK